ncbi:hypothetical protein LguiB_029386 [Lonicera macranthoides]
MVDALIISPTQNTPQGRKRHKWPSHLNLVTRAHFPQRGQPCKHFYFGRDSTFPNNAELREKRTRRRA